MERIERKWMTRAGTPIALVALGVIALAMTAKEHQAVDGASSAPSPSAFNQPAIDPVAAAAAGHVVVLPAVHVTERFATDTVAMSPALVEVAMSKMSPTVAAHASMGGDERVPVIVRYDDAPELFENERLRRLGGEVVRRFDRLGLLAVRLPAGALIDLAIADSVRRVSLDAPMHATMPRHYKVSNAPKMFTWNDTFNGSGVGVAVIDSGVYAHDDLYGRVRQYDFTDGRFPEPTIKSGSIDRYNSSSRIDPYGHGTLVAGIISGTGDNSWNYKYAGLAPDVSILSLRVLDENGNGVTSDAIAALEWLATYGGYFDVKVANLSIGKAVEESVDVDPLVLAAEALWDSGIAVVVAAGNHGRDGNMTITSPGNSPKVVTVGSLTDNGTVDTADDYVSTFSSRGPTLIDHILKPDLIAPGNKLVGAASAASTLAGLLSDRVIECDVWFCSDEYLEMSGTSLAAPLVSATIAILYEKYPDTMTPDAAKARLMRTARKIDADATAAGAGVLDINRALNETRTPAYAALSPKMARALDADVIAIQDTSVLWGGEAWGNGYLWTDGFLWSDQGTGANGYLWSDGDVGAFGYLWTQGYLWTDGSLSSNGYLWTQGYLWTDVVRDLNPFIDLSNYASPINDD